MSNEIARTRSRACIRTSVVRASTAGAFALLALSTFIPRASLAQQADGLHAWEQVRSVLEHPRCLNCHQIERPLQGDAKREHIPPVSRGLGGLGQGAMMCTNCHNTSGNNDSSGTPGAPGWLLAPEVMNWQGVGSKGICEQMKDPKRNGDRDGAKIVEHNEHAEVTLWAWKPGAGRSVPPISHEAFVKGTKDWVAAGMPCPAN